MPFPGHLVKGRTDLSRPLPHLLGLVARYGVMTSGYPKSPGPTRILAVRHCPVRDRGVGGGRAQTIALQTIPTESISQ